MSSDHSDSWPSTSSKDSAFFSYRPKLSSSAPKYVRYQDFLQNLNFPIYNRSSLDQKQEHVKKVDAVEMLTAYKELCKDLADTQTENRLLIDFLTVNNPTMLIGLTGAPKKTAGTFSPGHSKQSLSPSSSTSLQSRQTISSTSKTVMDYKLNYKFKAEIAEIRKEEVDRTIAAMEAKALSELTLKSAFLLDLQQTIQEAQDTISNFRNQFLTDEEDMLFLEKALERDMVRKLRRFTQNWLKRGRELVSKMRLHIASMRNTCDDLEQRIASRAEMKAVLSPSDMILSEQVCEDLQRRLAARNDELQGIKQWTGRTALELVKVQDRLRDLQQKLDHKKQQQLEVIKATSRFEHECNDMQEQVAAAEKNLQDLSQHLQQYEPVPVGKYMNIRGEIMALEKEEIVLRRQTNVAQMQLQNTLKRWKAHKREASISSGQRSLS